MTLEIYHIILLIFIGTLVGISMSFVGQTGQGVVVPLILLITGDVLLAITINVINDFIAASSVAINYVRKKQYYFSKNIIILIIISLIASFLGVLILITTPLSTIFGWFLPAFIIFLGTTILSKGFPTSESLKEMVHKISQRFLKKEKEDLESEVGEKKSEKNKEKTEIYGDQMESVIKPYSKLFYLLAVILGMFVGLNSGMFGANSGLIITLVLIILYGYPLKKSVGTALILSIIMCVFTFSTYQILGFTIKGRLFFSGEFILYLGISSFFTGFIISNYVQKLSAKAMGRGMGATMILLGLISLVFYFIN
ncbi:MAG: sulfite exporter TauE/SafE family protein [Candidatus Lokiarchaeota archaeon]|nr:sulfite exporter TauE/SafE family protein [Candidatus Lokiarchaeota archaeon]